jgi:hypothetical protein
MNDTQFIGGKVRTHAGSVDTLVTAVSNAQGASKHIKLGDEAYGKVCAWLPSIFNAKHDRMDDLLRLAKSNLQGHAGLLRKTADHLEGKDVDHGSNIDATAPKTPKGGHR